MKKSVLITGGSGLLAINWAQAIRDKYAVTLGLHKRQVSLANVQALPIDLESQAGMADALFRIKPDIVIHTAGLTNVERCEADPQLADRVNTRIAGLVAQASVEGNASLIHISTDHLFSGEKALVDETEPPNPKNQYGLTKAAAEERIREVCPQAMVIRTNFFGWGPSYRQSFSDVIINELHKGNTLTLFEDVYYTPILIEALVKAAHELAGLKAHGIFNVVGDDRISKYEFGLRIAEHYNLNRNLIQPGYLKDRPDLVQRPYDMSLNNQKACLLLGRKLGGIDTQIQMLQSQEKLGTAKEVRIH